MTSSITPKWSFMKSSKVSQDSQDEDRENLLPGSQLDKQPATSKSSHSILYATLLIIISSLISLSIGLRLGRHYLFNPDSFCIDRTSKYSPMLEDIEIKYDWVQFEGSLMHENIYRKNASPEVDEAWQALGVNYRASIVPDSLAAKSGLSPSQVQVSDKYGGGYPANVEGLHHLHCLNLLRQSLYYNYDYYNAQGTGAFVNSGDILRLHVSHCLDTIRQQLMCLPSIDVLGQVWYNPEAPNALPDFNTKHMCRNYDDIKQWAQGHQAPAWDELPGDYMKRPAPGDVLPEMP